jgi:hypothetical protein
MGDETESSEAEGNGRPESAEASRPQRAGEAATTRFGMEDGDNTDVPATGGPTADQEDSDQG